MVSVHVCMYVGRRQSRTHFPILYCRVEWDLWVICQGKESDLCEGAGTKLCSALPAGLSPLYPSIWWILDGLCLTRLEESPLLPGEGRLRE